MKSLFIKTCIAAAIIFSLCVTTAFGEEQPFTEPGAGSGYYIQQETGKQDKNTTYINLDGSAKYNYPMGAVSLDYSSNNGWSLGGYSVISRSTKDGMPDYGIYSKSNTFILDGEELVFVSQQGDRYEYRTKIDSMKKIYQQFYVDDDEDTEVSYWEINHPDGRVDTYREQVYFNGDPCKGIIRAWAITESHDRGNYNSVYYKYNQTYGELYIEKVISGKTGSTDGYATTAVTYETGGYNTDFNYIYGYRIIKGYKRASLVTNLMGTDINGNSVSGTVTTGGFEITYKADYLNHAVVESIAQLGSNMTSSLPPVTFDYYDFYLSFEHNPTEYTIAGDTTTTLKEIGGEDYVNALADFMDMNGDGLLDRVYKDAGTSYLKIWFNNGSGFGSAVTWTTADQEFLRKMTIEKETFEAPVLISYGENFKVGTINKYFTVNDLFDINGDGLPDRVHDNGTNLLVALNNGTQFLSETPWDRPGGENGIGHAEYKYLEHYHVSSHNERVYRDGQYVWVEVLDPELQSTDDILNTLSTTVDMNGDGLPDRASNWDRTGCMDVFNNNGANYSGTSEPFLGYVFSDPGIRLTNAGGATARDLMDINGDGLTDLVEKRSGNMTAFLNMGYRFNETAVVYTSVGDTATDDRFLRDQVDTDNDFWDYIDMNGDGRPDRVSKYYGGTANLSVWLNMGNEEVNGEFRGKFSSVMNPSPITDFHSLRAGRHSGAITDYIDINGDGLPDRVKKESGSQTLYVWLNTSGGSCGDPAGRLKEVRNGKGGTTIYYYKALDKTLNPGVKPGMWVINEVFVKDGLGGYYTTGYDYTGGVYDVREKEFRGFAEIKEKGSTGDYTLTGYYTDEYKKGLVSYKKTYNGEDALFDQTYYNYDIFNPGDRNLSSFPNDIKLVMPREVLTYTHDGDANSCRITQKTYSFGFDQYGLVCNMNMSDNGEVDYNYNDVGADKCEVFTTYINDPVQWVSGLEETVDTWGYEGTTGIYQRQAAGKKTYDSNYNLVKTENWNGGSTDVLSLTSQYWVNPTVYDYDTYGNVTEKIEPEGFYNGGGYNTQTVYDSKYNSYPVYTVNAMWQCIETVYDSFMRPITVRDVSNNIENHTAYDVFGRVTKKWGPLCTELLPNESITYYDALLVSVIGDIYTPETIVIKKKQNTGDDNYNRVLEMYDGLGRLVQTKSKYNYRSNNDLNYLTVDRYYGFDEDNNNLSKTSISYFTSSPDWTERDVNKPCTKTVSWLDTDNGKATRTVNTDNTDTFVYDRQWLTTTIDAKGVQKLVKRDGKGRTIEVMETKGNTDYVDPNDCISTRYEYRSGTGAQTNIIDTNNNYTSKYYNMLGQVTCVYDPDMGYTAYEYNANGAVTQKTTTNGYAITYTYDSMGRNIRIDYPDSDGGLDNYDEFIYDLYPGYNYNKTDMYAGKLLDMDSVRDGQLKLRDTFYYDMYGNMKEKERQIHKTGSTYNTGVEKFWYDLLGRVVKNNIGGEDIEYEYDDSGKVQMVVGLNSSGVRTNYYVSDINYTPFGAIDDITYDNTYTTDYTYYDTGTTPSYRLQFIEGPVGLNFANEYFYDDNGNVTGITDTYNSAYSQSFSYDYLNRMTFAWSSANGYQPHSYDDLGNMTQRGSYGALIYNTYKPHTVCEDSQYYYSYDWVGNMVEKAGKNSSDIWTYTYDWNNNLIEVQLNGQTTMTALYDPNGNRIRKTENGVTDYYFSSNLEKMESANGEGFRHNYFANGKRVAVRDWDNTLLYYFQDHLGSASRVIDADAVYMNKYYYEPYGATANEVIELDGKYKYNDKELDGTGLYYYGSRYYNPDIGRFISADTVTPGDGSGSQCLNRYAYCLNNPMKYVDPDGHDPFYAIQTLCPDLYIMMQGIDTFGREANSAVNQAMLGPYSNEVTPAGTALQFGIGLIGGWTGIDLPMDVRDISYDIKTWEWSWSHVGQTSLDAVGLLPVVGIAKNIKYLDELGAAGKEVVDYAGLAQSGTKHAGSASAPVLLGKHDQGGVSYVEVAKREEATYFELDDWDAVAEKIGMDNMWNINKEFLNQQWKAGKDFYFSHDPWQATGYFQQEVSYLIDLGVKDFVQVGDLWKAVR